MAHCAYLRERETNVHIQKYLLNNVYSYLLHNNLKLKNDPNVHKARAGKPNAVQSHSERLLGDKNEGSSETQHKV